MIWTCLGHAMWLLEVAGVRIVFDPLLGEDYHEGVFAVSPRRRIDLDVLQPDLVVVTHRHPDHFDPASLAAIRRAARRPPIVVTPDLFIARMAERLGFDTCVLRTWEPLPLDGATLLPTPSFCPVVEWGMLVATPDGTAWNQVDTELESPARVREVLARALPPSRGLDLAIVRWQPLQQVAAMLGERGGFPRGAYRREVEIAATTGARAVIPGASGSRYAGPHWMNQHAYPVPQARFLRDLQARCPGVATWPARVGGRWRVQGGVEELAGADWVQPESAEEPLFLPWEIPRLVDTEPADRDAIAAWIGAHLLPGLAAAWPGMGRSRPARLSLRVVHRDGPEDLTFEVGPDGARVLPGFDADYDAAVGITASALERVVTGRGHWGRALLGGHLRATVRGCEGGTDGVMASRIAAIFLYYGLGYEAAFERWVEREVEALVSAG